MFDHSDSIRDILQNAKEELKNNPELNKDHQEYQNYVEQTNGDQKLVLNNPKKNFDEPLVLDNLNEIKNNILTLTNEISENQDVLLLKNEVQIQDENILHLKNEYKPDLNSILELKHEINLDEPLLLNKEFETTITDLEKELSELSDNIVSDDPIYEKVETIDQQQSDIQSKLENIYEKIEDSDKETEVKLDLLSSKIENDVNDKIHNIDQSLEAIKNSTKIDELKDTVLEYNEELKSSLELSVSNQIGNIQVTVDSLLENNEIFKQEINNQSDSFKQEVKDQSELFKHEMLNSQENLRVEFLDNLRILEEERRRIEDERIERENSPQKKLEKRFDEISSILESHNLKMQSMYNTMEMQHNQAMVQNVMNNFMNNISGYEKKIEEKIEKMHEDKHGSKLEINEKIENRLTAFEKSMNEFKQSQFEQNNPIINLERKIEDRLRGFEKNLDNYKSTQSDARLINLETRIEERFRSLDQGHNIVAGGIDSANLIGSQISKEGPAYASNVNDNIELFKKFIDNKFLAFDDLVQNFTILSRSLKDQLAKVDGMTPDVVEELKINISNGIKSELEIISNKLLKFDDWMNAIQDGNKIKMENYKDLEKFNDIEEARQFISDEIVSNAKNWIRDNKNKIDELAKILLF